MAGQHARFIARVSAWQSTAEDSDGEITLHLEWKKLGGDREGGKYVFHSDPLTNEDDLRQRLKVALAAHLTREFPVEPGSRPVRAREIVVLL